MSTLSSHHRDPLKSTCMLDDGVGRLQLNGISTLRPATIRASQRPGPLHTIRSTKLYTVSLLDCSAGEPSKLLSVEAAYGRVCISSRPSSRFRLSPRPGADRSRSPQRSPRPSSSLSALSRPGPGGSATPCTNVGRAELPPPSAAPVRPRAAAEPTRRPSTHTAARDRSAGRPRSPPPLPCSAGRPRSPPAAVPRTRSMTAPTEVCSPPLPQPAGRDAAASQDDPEVGPVFSAQHRGARPPRHCGRQWALPWPEHAVPPQRARSPAATGKLRPEVAADRAGCCPRR